MPWKKERERALAVFIRRVNEGVADMIPGVRMHHHKKIENQEIKI